MIHHPQQAIYIYIYIYTTIASNGICLFIIIFFGIGSHNNVR
jgi:hypothetical protein